MSELKRKLIEETTQRINNWSEYDDMLYDYNKTDAINFLKRLSVGIYDNVIKNTYWFGYKITIDKLISWDKARKKNKSLSNITEENYLVFAEIHALMTHVKRINKYPKTYNRYYQTSESWHEQTPTTKKEQQALEQLYKSVLSQNYTWREAREISAKVSKLNIYENYKFPHIIEEIKEAFAKKAKVHFPEFSDKGTCYFDTVEVQKEALTLAKSINEDNLEELFSKDSKDHIEEYLRRMVLSMYDIPRLVYKRDNYDLKKNLAVVEECLSKSTTLSKEARDILFKKANKKELVHLAIGILTSLSHPMKQLNIFDTCQEFQKILNCNYGTVYYNDFNHLTLPNGEKIFSTPYEDIKRQYNTFQKKYKYFYENATDLEYVEGCAETLGSVLMSQIFREGNKRTARCLFNQMLISRGILPPVLDFNENENELWNAYAYSRKERFDQAIPLVLYQTITQAQQFKKKKFSYPLTIGENAHKRREFKRNYY